MKTSKIRKLYLDFFKGKQHTLVKSDSLIPKNDPSLLFTGAGMNQFKDYYMGIKKDLKRATSSQKCIRTGDLDVVGTTPYHHSFFEMLGNFSFGDYFKKETIEWAWEFLTEELGLQKDRLFVSVHHSDDEAFKIWEKHIGIPAKLIAKLDDHSNFWPADAPKLGPNGPCGPCSEIYYDQGENFPGYKKKGSWADDESGRFAEIWNLVFTQFERQEGGKLIPLKAKNIDTGMGLERLACVLQGKRSNFEIDLFEPVLKRLKSNGSKGKKIETGSLNAIADHARASVVAISDGAHPSNDGRGYVIRKLIRRAIWKGRILNLKQPILTPLVPIIVKTLEDQYPELRQAETSVTESIRAEESRFHETLESGLRVVQKSIEDAKKRKNKQLSGEEVFQLYDTFGFPDELTRTIARGSGITIDEKKFETLLEEQRKRAKDASKISNQIFSGTDSDPELNHLTKTKFEGYKDLESNATVLWTKFSGKKGVVALDQTPFYPEGGGQVGDRGMLEGKSFCFQVEDTQKKHKVILHLGTMIKGKIESKKKVKAVVNQALREATKRNHTATHLLQGALRDVIGPHVRQVGSLVNEDKLRFDFTHGNRLTVEELQSIENWVNEAIFQCLQVQPKQEDYDQAVKGGALAFFGDKYTDRVRTINIKGRSKELCGGTHCINTGEIGSFVITSEGSIGSGTRRLEAVTGLNTIKRLKSAQGSLAEISDALKTTPDQAVSRIQKLNEKVRDLEKERGTDLGGGQSAVDTRKLIQSAKTIGSVKLIQHTSENADLGSLRMLADQLRTQSKQSVVAIFSKSDEKVNLLLALSKDLNTSPLDAKVLAQKIAPLVSGSAGGRKDMAQGGGRNPNGIQDALNALPKLIRETGGQ